MITACCPGINTSIYSPSTSYSGFISPFATYRTPTMNFSCCGSKWSDYGF